MQARIQRKESFMHHGWGCEMLQPFWNIVWPFLKIVNMPLSYKSTIALMGIYPRKMKFYVHIKMCIQVFIATLFVIAPKNSPGGSTNVVLPYHGLLLSNTKKQLSICETT